MDNRVPYSHQVITMECGLVLHSQVIGLPYFLAPLDKDTEEAQPEPTTSVN